ncbi:sensor histidine kinase [Clostridium sp. ZS2-4]|uniref:sensor histidine kinase n=1 Tax=Clostridium sp. ZS2-4 TaxID=2987703 RepID=UPI00227BA05E|nr:PAS domain-containing sensor histidine kinase [Clostridium sp. ZS2-4]MCY6355301.1 PAS domain-containing sensor histidine kinase [Clostridium sp. ZS2-4]
MLSLLSTAILTNILDKHIKTSNAKLIKKQKELHHNQNMLTNIIDSINDGILVISLKGTITHTNKKLIEMWKLPQYLDIKEYDTASLMNLVCNQLKEPNKFKDSIQSIINSNKEATSTLRFKDDRIFKCSYRPLVENDEIIGRVWSFKDITQETTANKILKESADQYKKLIEFLPAGIFVHTNRKIVFANTNFAKLIGIDNPNMLIDRNFADFIHKDYFEIVEKRIRLVETTGKSVPVLEEKFIRLDSSILDVSVSTTPFTFEDKAACLVVVQDITEHKQAEALRKKIEEKQRLLNEANRYNQLQSEFFANLSHEFKTPLNVLYSSLQLMSLLLNNSSVEDLNETIKKMKNYVPNMKQNCFRLIRLLNNLIDITKLDSGYLDLSYKNENIIEIVENITLSVVEFVENKGLTLIFDTDTEEKIMACDCYKIERILLNLISNSIKFTPKGGDIFVNVYDKTDFVLISVRDTGLGIPEDKQHIIFERFRQVDRSLTRKSEGSGIGLSIVKSLVELMDGEITVKSELNKGSEFIIKLPVKLVEESASESHKEIACTSQAKIKNIQIEFSDIYSE